MGARAGRRAPAHGAAPQPEYPGGPAPPAGRGGAKKLARFARWWATPCRLDCAECRQRYARLGEAPECEGCTPPPRLFAENLSAWELWQLCADQVRTLPNGRLALDLSAVIAMARYLGLAREPEQRGELLVKVQTIQWAVMEARYNNQAVRGA
ncbi:MAG: DUF1799 domain-containing protein [Pseudomonadota bacterium]